MVAHTSNRDPPSVGMWIFTEKLIAHYLKEYILITKKCLPFVAKLSQPRPLTTHWLNVWPCRSLTNKKSESILLIIKFFLEIKWNKVIKKRKKKKLKLRKHDHFEFLSLMVYVQYIHMYVFNRVEHTLHIIHIKRLYFCR